MAEQLEGSHSAEDESARDDGEVEVQSEHFRPKRIGLFRSLAYETIAAMSVAASLIGAGSVGLELLLAHVTQGPPPGFLIGLPIPFISAPLGVGAVSLALLGLFTRPKTAIISLLFAVSYWALFFLLWPATPPGM